MLVISIIVVVFLLLLICGLHLKQRNKKSLKRKHVFISGGSSGIGLCLATEAIKSGASVTIIARNVEKLNAAEDYLKNVNVKIPPEERGRVQSFSCDVGGSKKMLLDVVQSSEISFGPIYMLLNCAGFSVPDKFEEISEEDVKAMVDVNFLGSFFLTQEVVRSMKRHDEGGSIVFVSSQGGLFGLFGFTGYAATKGAVIKLAEALHMEMKPLNISVTVGLPPDTDTPGFAAENKTKPVETRMISETAGLFKPDVVARTLLDDALAGKFYSTNGIEGYMLITLCAGMSPVTSLFTLIQEVFLCGFFRLIASFYLWNFNAIVKNEHVKRLKSKKSE